MFEVLEHAADIGFRARAGSLPELFGAAAEALVAIVLDPENVDPRDSVALAAEGDSNESLLVNWLSEVLYWLDGERFVMSKFDVKELSQTRISGEAKGEPRNPARHEPRLVVKGVTYHQLKIERDGKGWLCEVYLDV
jgi:SHS2 domain-containing protein